MEHLLGIADPTTIFNVETPAADGQCQRSRWHWYLAQIQTMLSKLYGPPVHAVLVAIDEAVRRDDHVGQQLIFFWCLNQEVALQRFEGQRSNHAKLTTFLPILRRHTEEVLDFKIQPDEYVQRCLESYIVS